MTPAPNSPKTIEGIEANVSITVLKTLANGFGAIFAMNNAVNTPTGNDISKDKSVMNNVDTMIKPILYKFDAKVSPMSHMSPVKNENKLTLPTPKLSVVKGMTPLTKTIPAITKINEADNNVADIKIILAILSVIFPLDVLLNCNFLTSAIIDATSL